MCCCLQNTLSSGSAPGLVLLMQYLQQCCKSSSHVGWSGSVANMRLLDGTWRALVLTWIDTLICFEGSTILRHGHMRLLHLGHEAMMSNDDLRRLTKFRTD